MKINIKNKNAALNLENNLKNQKQQAIKKTSKDALEIARSTVPVKSGKLRDSLKSSTVDNTINITSDLDYAHSVEYGDKNKKPSGFLAKTLLKMKTCFFKNM